MKQPSKSIILIAFLLILAGFALRIFFFNISTAYLPATADEILAIFIARDIADGARPLLFWGTPYQLPLESYLMAPFAKLLPPTAFGARILLAFFAGLATLGFLILLLLVAKGRNSLAGLLLIIFPSSYLIILQAGYFIPQHTATMHFAWILPLLCFKCISSSKNSLKIVYSCLTGLISGLALSTHLLSLPIVASVALAICVASNFRTAILNTLVFIPTLLIGLIPYLATYKLAQTANTQVTANYPLSEAIQRFFSDILNGSVSVVIGFNAVLFPDYQTWSGFLPNAIPYFLWIFWIMLIAATIKCVLELYSRTINERWPRLTIQDVFVGTCWACLIAFSFSMRAKSGEFRYLLPLAWAFPFIISHLYSSKRAFVKFIIIIFTLSLSALQVSHTYAIGQRWKSQRFRSIFTDTQDLNPIINYLDQQGISKCYAGFWFAYRYSYNTNGRIFCGQAYNERFTGWPLPYKKIIDSSHPVAYVLGNTHMSRLKASSFLKMLDFHRIESTVMQIFPFYVIHNFKYKGVQDSRLLSQTSISIASSNNSTTTDSLLDGKRSSIWTNSKEQELGDWIEFRFNELTTVHKLRTYFARENLELNPNYRVEYTSDGKEYKLIRDNIPALADRIYFDGKTHPYFFEDSRQDISFAPIKAKAIRMSVVAEKSQKPWRIAEIEIYEVREKITN